MVVTIEVHTIFIIFKCVAALHYYNSQLQLTILRFSRAREELHRFVGRRIPSAEIAKALAPKTPIQGNNSSLLRYRAPWTDFGDFNARF